MMARPKQPPWGRSPATFRNTETRAAARQLAQQRRASSSPLARFRTESGAIRAGFTYRQLKASPYGRQLIFKQQTGYRTPAELRYAVAQAEATARNQSYNYIVAARGREVTVTSDTPLTNQEAKNQAGKSYREHQKRYKDAEKIAAIFPENRNVTSRAVRVVGTYRGRIMRAEMDRNR